MQHAVDRAVRCAAGACAGPATIFSRRIGIDYGVGLRVRPWLNENAILEAGYASLAPGAAMRQIYGPNEGGGRQLHSIFLRSRFVY